MCNRKRLKILLTEGSSVSARQALFALGSRYHIDIMDPSAFCQGRYSRFVRRWYRCPSLARDPAAYLAFLVELLRSQRYDVLLPTHEQVYLVARFRELLGRYAGLAVPDFDALQRLQSKASFVRLLDELNLPHPRSEIVRTRPELESKRDFPYYVKVPYSTAGTGVRRVDDLAQLRRAADELELEGVFDGKTEILVQEPARGTQATVSAVFQHGRLVAWHCAEARALGVGGSAMAQVSASHAIVVEHVCKLGRHLDWHGGLFLDYFYDQTQGQPQYIEANPRIGPSVSGVLSGVNLCEQWVQVALDHEVSPMPPPRVGVKTHQGFLILMALALEGATRRQLLAELLRAWRRGGLYAESQDELMQPREDWLSVIPALAVSLQLVVRPGSARGIVKKTVANYSLTEAAARVILTLSADGLPRQFE